jgi:hypothetical protein
MVGTIKTKETIRRMRMYDFILVMIGMGLIELQFDFDTILIKQQNIDG